MRGLPGARIGELASVDAGIDAATLRVGIDAERRGPGGGGAAIGHAVDPPLMVPEADETIGRVDLIGQGPRVEVAHVDGRSDRLRELGALLRPRPGPVLHSSSKQAGKATI